MGPSRGDTICGNVVIEALGPMHFGALALGPIHMARSPTVSKMWLATIERTLLPRSVDVSRFMAGLGQLASSVVRGAVPLTLVDREADFCVVGYRAIEGARTLATIAEAGVDEAAARVLAVELATTLCDLHRLGAVHGLLTPTTVIYDGSHWLTWEYGIAGHCAPDRLAPRLRPLGGDAVAPELRAGGEVSPASDVFGWGTAVACLLTGTSGSDAIAMLHESDETDPLRELVRSALESIPELRPRDGAVVLTRLAEILGLDVPMPSPAADRTRFGLPEDPPAAADSSEFSFADLNEPTPAASSDTARSSGSHEIVELLVLGPDDDPDDDEAAAELAHADPAPAAHAAAPGEPAVGTAAAERWRELAEQYLTENRAAAEGAIQVPELEATSASDRRSVEALGRVALVKTRVRTGPQPTAAMDHVAVSGAFDMSQDPEPEPAVHPRAAEGARDLPLGNPDDDEEWDDPEAAVFDLDAPGAPQVGGHDVDPDPDEVLRGRSATPWSEPTPVDGLGTRRLAGEFSPPPQAVPSPPEPAPQLAAEPVRRPTPKPVPVAAETSGSGETLRLSDEPPRPRVSLDEAPPVSPSRARTVSSSDVVVSLDRTPSRPMPSVDRSGSSPILAELSHPRSVRERSGSIVAWLVALSAGVIAVGVTLAAARERGGLSRLLGGEPAVPLDDPGARDASAVVPASTSSTPAVPRAPGTECPATMRPIEGIRVCIDEAEAPGLHEIPTTRVGLAAARAACAERGARLCTAAQWRAACRGPRNWRHPYGSRAEVDRCNGAAPSGEIQDLSRAGARDGCVTPAGVYDLEGNVGEWVEDGSVLGGDSTTRAPSCDSRSQPGAGATSPSTGFRCCSDLAESR